MKSLHQRSGSGVAILGPVRPLMEDTLSKPSEHGKLCVEQIIVAYLIKSTATLTGVEVDVLQCWVDVTKPSHDDEVGKTDFLVGLPQLRCSAAPLHTTKIRYDTIEQSNVDSKAESAQHT